jgi:hypothetical protein
MSWTYRGIPAASRSCLLRRTLTHVKMRATRRSIIAGTRIHDSGDWSRNEPLLSWDVEPDDMSMVLRKGTGGIQSD